MVWGTKIKTQPRSQESILFDHVLGKLRTNRDGSQDYVFQSPILPTDDPGAQLYTLLDVLIESSLLTHGVFSVTVLCIRRFSSLSVSIWFLLPAFMRSLPK